MASANDFQLNLVDPAKAGADGVCAALVGGAAQDEINLRMSGETFNLIG